MILAKLANEMTHQKMRPEDLAHKTGLSIRTILNARDGKSVSLGTAALIAQKLKVKTADLVVEEVAHCHWQYAGSCTHKAACGYEYVDESVDTSLPYACPGCHKPIAGR